MAGRLAAVGPRLAAFNINPHAIGQLAAASAAAMLSSAALRAQREVVVVTSLSGGRTSSRYYTDPTAFWLVRDALAGSHEPGFRLDLMLKDLALALDTAASPGVLPLGKLV